MFALVVCVCACVRVRVLCVCVCATNKPSPQSTCQARDNYGAQDANVLAPSTVHHLAARGTHAVSLWEAMGGGDKGNSGGAKRARYVRKGGSEGHSSIACGSEGRSL